MTSTSPRLAIFMSSLSGGGAERAMVNLANDFVSRGIAVEFILMRREGPYLADLDSRIAVVDLGVRRMLLCLPALHRHLSRNPPQVVLSAHFHASDLLLAGRLLVGWPVRVVISAQNMASELAASKRNHRERLFPMLIRWLFPRADALVAISAGVADDLRGIVGNRALPLEVIHNPVVTPQLIARMDDAPDHPWLLDGGPPVVMTMGRFVPQKDLGTLLEAFAMLVRERPARLLIAGDGEGRRALEAQARDLGIEDRVSMPGFIANPYPTLSHAAVFALSSRWEGFANVVAEALACGVPVVSTDCPSGPAEILGNGAYGRLVPIGDAAALAQALAATLEETPDRERLRARGRDFDVAPIAERYLALLFPPSST